MITVKSELQDKHIRHTHTHKQVYTDTFHINFLDLKVHEVNYCEFFYFELP